MTITMYNPYVPDELVEIYLRHHCAMVKGGTKLPHSFGCWSGRRRYVLKLKQDPRNPGEFLHLPSVFSIGPHRGLRPTVLRWSRGWGKREEGRWPLGYTKGERAAWQGGCP